MTLLPPNERTQQTSALPRLLPLLAVVGLLFVLPLQSVGSTPVEVRHSMGLLNGKDHTRGLTGPDPLPPLTWSELLPSATPALVFNYPLAYDPATQQTLLFEETLGPGPKPIWSFSSGAWTNVTPSGGIEAQGLSSVSMAYDVADGYLVLFGSSSAAGDQTWEYQAGVWTQLSPPMEPYGPVMAGLTYDAADSVLLLLTTVFGGGHTSTLTWSFHAGTWSLVPTALAPPPVYSAAMAFDNSTSGHKVLLFDNQFQPARNETWTYHNGTWQNVTSTSGRAPPNATSIATYDASDGFVLLLTSGALPGHVTDRTWEYVNGAWVYANAASTVPYVGGGALAYDAHDGYPLFVGRWLSLTTTNQSTVTWKFDHTDIGLPPTPVLTVTPVNVPLGQSVRILASVVGGYGVLGARVNILAPGCNATHYGLGAENCTPTAAGASAAILSVTDQAGRHGFKIVPFNVTGSPPLPGWVFASVGVAVAAGGLAAASILIYRRKRRVRPPEPVPLGPQ